MSLIPLSSHVNPKTTLFVKMFKSTEAEISTLYASTIYAGNIFVSTLGIVGGDFQIINGSSIFDTFVGPSSVTQSLNIDGDTVGQIIISTEDRGLRFIDSDETRYIMGSSTFTIHNPLAENQNAPTARYGVQDINLSTVSTSVDMFLDPLTNTFETSLLIQGNQAGIITMGSNIVLQDATDTSFIFGSTLKMRNNQLETNPLGIYDPSSITLSTPQSFVKIEQNNITMVNPSTFVNQFLGTGSFETSLVTAGDQTAILTLASTTVLEDNYQTRYSFGSSNFIINNLVQANQPTAFVSPSTIFISTASSLTQLNDRSLTFAGGENIFNVFASPDQNFTEFSYLSGGEEVAQLSFLSSIGGIRVADTFGNPSFFASNAFTTANINADNITTRNLTAKTIRVISTIYSESTISTVVLLADSITVSSILGGDPIGDLNLNTTRFITQTGTRVRLNASNGFNAASAGAIEMNAGGGNFGQIAMTANPGILGNFGRVSITANGGQNDLVGLGGLVEITATTPIGTAPPATSAIKLSAAGINSYAGAIPSIGSLAGYNFIYGTAGVNITAGIPSIFPNIPLTTYIYGTAGVVIGSDLYASDIYGYWSGFGAPSNLVLRGRNTAGGSSLVVLSNVSSINGQRWPPPSTVTVSTFNDLGVFQLTVSSINNQRYPITSFNTFNVTGLTVSSINNEQYPPNIETLSTFQNIYVASTIQVASSISFVLNGTSSVGVITGVSSINGIPFPPPDTEFISTFSTIFVQDEIDCPGITRLTDVEVRDLIDLPNSNSQITFTGNNGQITFANATGSISGVSSINNLPYPYTPESISYCNLNASSINANTISTNTIIANTMSTSSLLVNFELECPGIAYLTNVGVTQDINFTEPGGTIQFDEPGGRISFNTGGEILGVSSINNIPYPPPAGDAISSFATFAVSSLSTSFTSAETVNVSYDLFLTSTATMNLQPGARIEFETFSGNNVGQIFGLSSINGAVYPPPAADAISSFATFAVSSLSTSFTSADTVNIQSDLFIRSSASINIQSGGYIDFETVAGSNVGYIFGLSSVNNLPYPPPAPDAISSFATFAVSSLSTSFTSADTLNISYDLSIQPGASINLRSTAYIFFDTVGGSNVGIISGVSTINGLSYPPPEGDAVSTFQTASISSLVVSSINNAIYPPPAGDAVSTFQTASISSLSVSSVNGIVVQRNMALSSLYVAGFSQDGIDDAFETGIHMARSYSMAFPGSGLVFFGSQGAETAQQGTLAIYKSSANYANPVGSTIAGLAVIGFSTNLTSAEPIIARSISFGTTGTFTTMTGDNNGNIIFPFSSIVGISTINGAVYPAPGISTFSTFAVSSFTADNITASSLTAERVSTQALYFSSLNDYGFSTLSEWNVSPSGYAVTGSNNKFYMGQSNTIEIIQDVNDRFMLYAGSALINEPSTLISSILTPGIYDSPSTFTSEIARSISTASGNFTDIDRFFSMEIQQTAGFQGNRLLWSVRNFSPNLATGTGMAFFSTTTGYGTPMIPQDVLSSCAQIMGVTYGSSIGYPNIDPLPYPSFYSFERPMLAASAVEITIPEDSYSPNEIVSALQSQFSIQQFPFNQVTVTAVNRTFDEFGDIVSQGLQFGIVSSNYPYFSLGFSFLNSGGTNSNWDLNTTTVPILQGAATFLGFPINSQVTWSNFNGGVATGSNTEIGAPIPFGSNMDFNSVDVLTLRTSTINSYSFQTIATQNGIGSNYTITEQANNLAIGYSNIHHIIDGYNNRFFITGFSGGSNFQEIVVIPPGIYDHPEFVSTVNPAISSVQGTNTSVWPPGDPGNRIALEIATVSSYYTTYQISTVLFAEEFGFSFTNWNGQIYPEATLNIVSTTAAVFGMTPPSTILGAASPVSFPTFSQTGGSSTLQLTPGTYQLQSLADSINASITALGFPYDNILTTVIPTSNPDGSVSEGSLVFAGSSSTIQGFIGFNDIAPYPFFVPFAAPIPNLAQTASTLGFLQGDFVVNQEISTIGAPIIATPAFFGSNMQFNVVNVNELNVSSINGGRATQATYYKTTVQNLTSGATDITFDATGAWNYDRGYITHVSGTTNFTVVQTGLYQLEFNAFILLNNGTWTATTNKNIAIDITRPSIAEQGIIANTSLQAVQNYSQSVSGSVYLVAGDVINCRLVNTYSAGNPTPPQAQCIQNTFDLNTFFTWRYVSV